MTPVARRLLLAAATVAAVAASAPAAHAQGALPQCDDATAAAHQGKARDVFLSCYDSDTHAPLRPLPDTPAHGTLTPDASNPALFRYTPAAGYAGQDTVSFHATNNAGSSNTATLTVTVEAPGTNQAPSCRENDASPFPAVSGHETPFFPDCSDPENDPVTIAVQSQPSHGTVDKQDVFLYTPASTYSGPDALSVVATDDIGASSAPTPVHFDVNPPAPSTCQDGTLTATSGRAATYTPACTDPQGDALDFTVVGDPAHGTATAANGSVSYRSTAGYTGADSFMVKAVSDHGVDSDPFTISVTVQPDAAPACPARSIAAREGIALPITLHCTDAEGDTLAYSIVSSPSHGTLSAPGPDGTATYTATDGYIGADSFTYKADDGDKASNTATVTLSVSSRPHAPVCDPVTASASATQLTPLQLSCTDADGDALTYAIATQPKHGSVSTPDSAGRTFYQAAAGFSGRDTFTYRASDGALASSPVTVSIDVVADRVPTCRAGRVSTAAGRSVALPLSCSDPDTDGVSADGVSYAIVAQPAHGRLAGTGSRLTYTPTKGFAGADSVTYDGRSQGVRSAPARILIQVAAAAGSRGTTPGSTSKSAPAATVSSAKLRKALAAGLARAAKTLGRSHVRTLAKRRKVALRFSGLLPGKVTLQLRTRGKTIKLRLSKAYLASKRVSVSRKGKVTTTLKLSKRWGKLLKRKAKAKRSTFTLVASYKPKGRKTIATSKSVRVKR